MHYLVNISLRNLSRQKRRNILLGTAIAIGVMILVIANSFSHGISDIMFNKIMRWVTGHVSINTNEKGNVYNELCRDKERVISAARKADTEGVITQLDEGIGMMIRVIGNGKSDNAILVGVDAYQQLDARAQKEVEESFRMLEGSFEDIKRTDVENPLIVSEEKARHLNVKLNDVLRMRFRNVFGQDQAARGTVVGIMKNDNMFMQPVIFLELKNTKAVLGFRPHETGAVSMTIREPQKNAKPLADRIHALLSPGIAVIYGDVQRGGKNARASVLGLKADEESRKKLPGLLKTVSGKPESAWDKNGVFITRALAGSLGAATGDKLRVTYEPRFGDGPAVFTCTVSGVFEPGEGFGRNVILINEDKFYDAYYADLPKPEETLPEAFVPKEEDPWRELVASEWVLLKRSANTDELKNKYKEMSKRKWKAALVDVRTMYESASDILKLEGVLNLITFSAVLILFFIILIGVVNTLRMTIRERTREIGTIRAIGMQKRDVRNIFILETFFLALISSGAGLALSFVVMHLLSLITFTMHDNPMAMLLVNGHLHFLPTVGGIAGNLLLILVIAVATAWFPARRAANFSPAKALRHYE